MAIRYILFDLDGTLLPMDQDIFVNTYFKLLAKKLAPYGYEPQKLIQSIWAGTKAMIVNDGSCLNEEAFWKVFTQIYGPEAINHKDVLDEFYSVDFQQVQQVCGFAAESAQVIRRVKELGFSAALATNPIFPGIATMSRIRWAGLNADDFDLITVYENCRFSKPNLNYYRDILDTLHVKGEECVMVGNDVTEDMVTRQLGMQVFLLTDCIINKDSQDISQYPHGSFADLLAFLETLSA